MPRTAPAVRRLAGGSLLLVLAAACAEPTMPTTTTPAALAASTAERPVHWKRSADFASAGVFLVARDGAVYAGDDANTLYRSADEGRTWAPVAGYPANVGVLSLAEGEKGELYAGTTNGVYRAADGETWESLGLDGLYITAIGRTVRGSVFAAATGRDGGVFRYDIAEDGSATWTTVFPSINPREFIPTFLAIAPNADLVLGTRVDGEWLTRNGGAEWEYLHYAGIPDYMPPVTDMEFMADGSIIASWYGGLLRSLDGGASWMSALSAEPMEHLTVAPDGSVYAASIRGAAYRSEDGGRTWTTVAAAKKGLEVRALAVTASGRMLAGGWDEVWASEK